MFIDASALIAMLTDETDAAELLARMQNHKERTTSPLAIWETVIAVSRILGLSIGYAHVAVEEYLKLMSIRVMDVPADTHRLAIEAFERFGKGRHPAALNFGDCFAYTMARQTHSPLLYKGDDFAQTDIEAA